jgi:NTP pyrophosphatase (non-canonical NTP hydrolase)
MQRIIENIQQWHQDRNLIAGSTDKDQVLKLLQELGELSDHVCKDSHSMLIADDLGDMMVVMINIMTRNNLTMQDCLEKAYEDIKNRKGKMIDGIFVKEESPGDHIPRQLGGKKN